MSVEVRMVQQMSGPHGGGDWPPPGGTMMVSEEDAEILCHTDAQHPTPIAVRVEAPKTEVATAPPAAVEVAQGAADEAAERAVPPPPPPPAGEQPVKRGPGRPPGSTNRPK